MTEFEKDDFYVIKKALENQIAEYNNRLGYLGANWENEIYERYDANQHVSFRVYFDYDYCTDIYLDAGTWTISNYLEKVVSQALEAAYEFIDDGNIDSLLIECFEMTF